MQIAARETSHNPALEKPCLERGWECFFTGDLAQGDSRYQGRWPHDKAGRAGSPGSSEGQRRRAATGCSHTFQQSTTTDAPHSHK
mmetsp:Transcript_785/g.1168  ORF Transcript_785/g.1168 Transcript_785/m.1168 type:complete len:85 (+) Transcript_785:31-285(+)